jgi:hypothetical protein
MNVEKEMKMQGKMFKLTIWTDFEVPSSDLFLSEEAARYKGEHALRELGCSRYTITEGKSINWQPASRLTIRNWKKGSR